MLVASAWQAPDLACLRVWGRPSSLDHNSRIRVSSILVLVVQVTTRIRCRSIFFPTSCLTQEKKKFEYRRATYKIRRRVFCHTSRSRQESEGFLPTSYIQGQEVQEAKEAIESARAGLSQKRKEKRKTKEGGLSPQEGDVKEKEKEKDQGRQEGSSPEGKVPCALNQEFLFLVHEYLDSERPVSFEISAPVWFLYEEAMCKGSSGNGLLYAAKAVP